MPKQYVVAEPGGGLFQGLFLGLCFCWDGSPNDDLPQDEVIRFATRQEADILRTDMVKEARAGRSRSLSIIERWETIEVEEGQDLTALASDWASRS